MTTFLHNPNRRHILAGLALGTALPFVPRWAHAAPKSGGTLTIVTTGGPTYLNAAISTSGTEALLCAKLFDGLFDYAEGMVPEPQLAESWEVSPDGLRITFNLRQGVVWHDGTPFTAEDVKVSVLEILKVHHGRGKVTFDSVTDIETPDPHTAIFVLSKPTPWMMSALNAAESPILPAHLYKGTDIMANPANLAPVGTGPFRLGAYTRGESLVMERNPDYWDQGKPYVDRIVMRFIADGSTRAAMLESGEADFVGANQLPATEILRFQGMEGFEVTTRGYEYVPTVHICDYNLRRPLFQNKLVRQALAHAVDPAWITDNIWFGFGAPGTGPIHAEQKTFYSTDGVPQYPYDLARAEAMLDEAGYPRKDGGIRFSLTIDASTLGEQPVRAAEYMREQFREIGVEAEVRISDPGAYVTRIYTERDFDLSIFYGSAGADPAIGVHRFYWSKNIRDGVPYSNGSGYSNPEVDTILEAASVEVDLDKRKQLYLDFQRKVMEDIPTIPLCSAARITICRAEVKDHTIGAIGAYGNLASAWLDR